MLFKTEHDKNGKVIKSFVVENDGTLKQIGGTMDLSEYKKTDNFNMIEAELKYLSIREKTLLKKLEKEFPAGDGSTWVTCLDGSAIILSYESDD